MQYTEKERVGKPVKPADVREAARLYSEHHWFSVPLLPGSKASSLKNWPKLRISDSDIDSHFARDANIGLLLGEVSGNLTDIDLDCAEAVLAAQILLPDTPMKHGRPSSPTRHYWYRCDRASSTVRIKGPDGACIAELRSGTNEKASYTMVPPSVHPDTGEIIAWEGPLEPAEVPYDDLFNALREVAAAALVAQFWKQGSRHEFALALAGYFAFGGVPEEKACRLMTAISHASGDTELQDRLRAIETTYRGYERGEPVRGRQGLLSHLDERAVRCLDNWLEIRPVKGTVKNPGRLKTPNPADAELTDLGNAKRFVVRFGADIRYVPAWGWMYWDENRWAKDELGRVRLRVCEMIQEMAQEAERMARIDDKIRKLKWTHQSQSNARLNAVLEIAAYQEPVACHSSCFDTDPWAFNVQNGTIDLEYGTIRPHCPTDLCHRKAPHDSQGAYPPVWKGRVIVKYPEAVYDNFGTFLSKGIEIVKNGISRYPELLDPLERQRLTGYGFPQFMEMTVFILSRMGWHAFMMLVALLAFGSLGFTIGAAALFANPVLAGAILLMFGGQALAIRMLYKNKAYLHAQEALGKKFKPEFDDILTKHPERNSRVILIENLMQQCVRNLCLVVFNINSEKFLTEMEELLK